MSVRRIALVVALLASPVAQGATGAEQPSSDASQEQGSTTKEKAEAAKEKAQELGQQGTDAAGKGARSARDKVNEGGQAAVAAVVGKKTVSGKVADVSREHVTIHRSDGQPMDLRVTPGTKVTVGGQKKPVGALQQGADVRVSYARSGGEATALEIDVTRTPRARAGAAKAESGAASSGSSGRQPQR